MKIANSFYQQITPNLKKDLDRYMETGFCSSPFLRAVLSNDLRLAADLAKGENQVNLVDLVEYLKKNLSLECWGSEERVHQWSCYRTYWGKTEGKA